MSRSTHSISTTIKTLWKPQERENQVALVYKASESDHNTRLVHLKATKCSCLAFQDHKIPCRHAIATARCFRVDSKSLIAYFYLLSVYRDQYKYTLEPVLLSELQPDGVIEPPPGNPARKGPVQWPQSRD